MSVRDVLAKQQEDIDDIREELEEHAFERVSRRSTIAPITRHGLEPATSIEDVSFMAGYRDDYLDEVPAMVLGHQDATKELELGKSPSDPRSPLEVDPTFLGVGAELHVDEEDKYDWCACL